jgi:hypothetical protein
MYCMAGRRVRNGFLRPLRATPPDPYGPNSPDYNRRHRETVTTLLNGTVRVDLGDPIKPTQPSPQSEPRKAEPQAPAPAAPQPEPPEATSATAPKVRPREHRAITRNP